MKIKNKQKKNYKNTNESKNINVKCYYYNNNYLQRKEKLEEMIKNYVEKMNEIVKEKYKKELKLKRHGKKLLIMKKQKKIQLKQAQEAQKINQRENPKKKILIN